MRRDIQGLRAIAVLAVIVDHLFHWPSGGFVGVDVFFVISGFLITGVLLREADRTGSISFVGFYKRRIKRIMPAATLVIVVTIAASFALLSAPRAWSTVWDGFWAFFFSANWNFAIQGTDYFDAAASPSPFQHYWSLSVEEQFYFVWPWLMLVILLIGNRLSRWTSRHSRTAIGVTLAVLVLASFAWSVWESGSNPTVSYFSTLSRAWELGVGALVAVTATTLAKMPHSIRPFLAWLGIAGIVASLFLVNAATPFPAPGAALPVLSSASVIVAGLGGQQRYLFPLTNRVSNYLGDISYSLYLWHFPVIVLLASLIPVEDPAYFVVALAAMFLLSIFAFHLAEDPIRKSEWLSGGTVRERDQRRQAKSGRVTSNNSVKFAGLGLLAAVSVTLVGVAILPQSVETSASTYVLPTAPPSAAAVVLTAAQTERQQAVRTALAATSWPELRPSLDDFTNKGRGVLVSAWMKDGCLAGDNARSDDPVENAEHCVYGNPDAPNTALLYGDSVAISYVNSVQNALGDDWRVLVYTMSGCSFSDVPVTLAGGAANDACGTFRSWVLDQADQVKPALTIVSEAADEGRLQSAVTGSAAVAEYGAGAVKTLTRLSAASKDVVVLSRPPSSTGLLDCYTPTSKPANCLGHIRDLNEAQAKSYAASAIAAGANVRFVDTRGWFCYYGDCPAFIDAVPVKADAGHLTESQSASLGSLMREVLLPAV